MNKNSIIATSTSFPDTNALAKSYANLEAYLLEAASVQAILKEAKSNLCEAPDFIPEAPSRKKYGFTNQYQQILDEIAERTLQREHRRIVFYAARLRVQNMIEKLKKSRRNLMGHIDMYREQFEDRRGAMNEVPRDYEIAQINIFFCNQLAFEAYERLAELNLTISHGVSITEHWAFGKKIDLKASLAAEHARSKRIWVVQYSGNGGKFHFDSSGPDEVPPGPYLTFDEAVRDALGWECTADTIGGMAQLYNVETGEITRNFR